MCTRNRYELLTVESDINSTAEPEQHKHYNPHRIKVNLMIALGNNHQVQIITRSPSFLVMTEQLKTPTIYEGGILHKVDKQRIKVYY